MRLTPTLALRMVGLVAVGSATARAQGVGPQYPESAYNHGSFRFGGDARSLLRALWGVSVEANAERVACIGGYRSDSVVYVTRIAPVTLSGAASDSVHITAEASLSECAPPLWLGTVHTHIAKFGGLPFVTFSAPDRNVMLLWHQRWKADGVFCVLYSEIQAYCEAGPNVSGEATYASRRGNNFGQ